MNDTEIPTPVETSSEASSDPRIKGYLSPQKLKAMQALRQSGRDLVTEIGMLEVRKTRLMSNLAQIEAQGEALVTEEARKVGVPEGAAFSVTPEGAILVNGPVAVPAPDGG
jgi:hypothetical protein